MADSHAITSVSEGGLFRDIRTECHVTPGFDPSTTKLECNNKKYTAIWDTGATNSVITRRLVEECDLKPVTVVKVKGVHGPSIPKNVYFINITTLPNNFIFSEILVTEGDLSIKEDILIGMDIITLGDFSITNKNGVTCFSFRVPSQHHIDYVDDIVIVKKPLTFD
ncbi:MAG: retroviral-like aspartic protease family protein [Nitrosomonas sp.]|nr:retroviral-like aspartic protease family protein [Nitrosomonas sp.]